MDASSCVVLVAVQNHIVAECEQGLQILQKRGYEVRRVHGVTALDVTRAEMAHAALTDSFPELLWISPEIAFDADDVEKIRRHKLPLVCGLYPHKGRRELSCTYLPGTEKIQLGQGGGLIEVRYAGLGFALTRREVYETLRVKLALPECNQRFASTLVPWFMPQVVQDGNGSWYLTGELAFCERARRCEFRVMADTSIRLWHHGSYAFGWEDAGADKDRYTNYTFHLPAEPAPVLPVVEASESAAVEPAALLPSASSETRSFDLPRNAMRGDALPLPAGFPRLAAFFVSYAANVSSLELALESFRASDWGEEPTVLMQPEDWTPGMAASSRNYRRALEAAADSGCDFGVFLEDDVRVNRWLRHNLATIPLVCRDQCDYLSLFMPDLISSPWERQENHLGYRLARPLYSGPNDGWEKWRIWGSQAYVLSRRFILASLERWNHLKEGQDARVLSICQHYRLPMWYSAPCLIQHAPLRSVWATPTAYAADFDLNFRFEPGRGFQPPEEVPGWLTHNEGKLLWQEAAGRKVLELGTAGGRATVCLAQQAQRVVTVDSRPQTEAREWVSRYGLSDRVEFVQGQIEEVCRNLRMQFDLVLVDTEHDAASLTRDIAWMLTLLKPGGRVAFHDYPDPGWPDVRRVVDEYAQRLGWKRAAQADYLGLFGW